MSDNVGLVAKAIGAVAINAVFIICLLIYCYEHGMGHRWGTPIIIADTFLNMWIMAFTLVVIGRRNKEAR
jgi:hypothetical protein